ncbi:hypothetical protein BH23PLA1_BH23PLA1_11170 [soil metagenome]
MDLTGQIVLGAPGEPVKQRIPRSIEPIDLDIAGMIQRIPRSARIGGAVLAVGVLLVFLVSRMVGMMGAPTELTARATYVGERFVDKEYAYIKPLMIQETLGPWNEWLIKTRSTFNLEGPRKRGDKVIVHSDVIHQSGGGAVTTTDLLLLSAPTSPPSENILAAQNSLTLELHWVQEGNHWRIDGQATLNAYNRPRPPNGQGR